MSHHQSAVRVTGFNPSKSTLVWSSRSSILQVENSQGVKYVDCGPLTWNQAFSLAKAKGVLMISKDLLRVSKGLVVFAARGPG